MWARHNRSKADREDTRAHTALLPRFSQSEETRAAAARAEAGKPQRRQNAIKRTLRAASSERVRTLRFAESAALQKHPTARRARSLTCVWMCSAHSRSRLASLRGRDGRARREMLAPSFQASVVMTRQGGQPAALCVDGARTWGRGTGGGGQRRRAAPCCAERRVPTGWPLRVAWRRAASARRAQRLRGARRARPGAGEGKRGTSRQGGLRL